MLQQCARLSQPQLDAIAELEGRTVAADGGRLKLEWGSLTSRSGDEIEDLLWWDGERLTGFLGLYAFGRPTVEVAGMVDPAQRRRGIGTALVDAAIPLIIERGYSPALLVCPRATGTGAAFARSRGAVLEHSEHALRLGGDPVDGPSDPAISLRPAAPDDVATIVALLEAGFHHVPSEPMRVSDERGHVIVERDGRIVGYLRTSLEDGVGGVYGFVVEAALRGQGIGRDVLRRVCRQLRADGARWVGLEVAVDNEHALGLYTSLGFRQVITEDYYRLPLPERRR